MTKLMTTVAALLLIGFTAVRFFSSEPSSFFQGLDDDKDEVVSYREWMAYYSLKPLHDHPIDQCSRVDFYYADCNQDDKLSWEEYSNFRFKKKVCKSPAVLTPRQMYEQQTDLTERSSRAAFEKMLLENTGQLKNRESELKKRYGLSVQTHIHNKSSSN